MINTAVRRYLSELLTLDAVRVTVDDSTVLIDILYTLVGTGEELALTIAQPLEVAP